MSLKHESLTQRVIGVFYEVYNELGAGFLESVYETAFRLALEQSGMTIQCQVPINVWFRGQRVGEFKADLLVESKVLLELKAVRTLDVAYDAQLLNYLRATEIEIGLLFNFGPKPEFRRHLYENVKKKHLHRDE